MGKHTLHAKSAASIYMTSWQPRNSYHIVSSMTKLKFSYYYCVFIWVSRTLDHIFGCELHLVMFGLLCGIFVQFIHYIRDSVGCLLSSVYRCRIYQSCVCTYVELFVWISLHSSSNVLVFQLVRRMYGRLQCTSLYLPLYFVLRPTYLSVP